MKNRLNADMTIQEFIVTMADGNPGAAVACTELVKADAFSGVLALLTLDEMRIYGSDIWVAYKDVCGQDVKKLLAAITARDPRLKPAGKLTV